MTVKETHFLRDDPATSDELGTHAKLADLIRDEIRDSHEGRSIALVGDWGSGKSTIIELLKSGFAAAEHTHLFIYDAWSHQGDSLRRAFLDDFIGSLKGRITDEQAAKATEQVWNRTETTTSTSEPVLRRHAKMLLISLALIPLGMKLFNVPAGQFPCALFSWQNLVAYFFLLSPVVAVFILGFINSYAGTGIKTFFFGESHDSPDFSVLSFFFEKVQGRIERKHIKTPVDSIQTFREVFSQLLDDAHVRDSELRIAIIIDNIDRIPADQARDFWSTMQTFFGDGGGLRRPQSRKYWLVAPFSVEALSFLFRNASVAGGTTAEKIKDEARTKAQSYIDKTFGLAFYVPPPILTNWRRYLLAKLQDAFPQHSEPELIAVREVYDVARGSAAVTPRDMKLFINALVVLHRQRGDEMSLAVMAVYVLKRESIGTTIDDKLLSAREQRLIDERDWRIPIAALHFGVTADEATQLLLEEPMLSALREGSKAKLKEFEPRPGFTHVLGRVVRLQLELPDADKGGALATMAATVGALDGASKPELTMIWRTIGIGLRRVKVWEGLSEDSAPGITAALTHSGENKGALANTLAEALTKAAVPELDGDFQSANSGGANWLASAMALIESIGPGKAPNIGFPGTIRMKIEILLQVAESEAAAEAKKHLLLNASPDEFAKGLHAEITAGRFPRAQSQMVKLLVDTLGIDVPWTAIVTAAAERLKVADLGAKEADALIVLLISVRSIGGFEAAGNALRELSTQGHLSHLLHLHRKQPMRSTIIAGTVLANPEFNRPTQIEQSASGDAVFNDLLASAVIDPSIVQAAAQLTKETRSEVRLFEAGSSNAKVARFAAAVMGQLAQAADPFPIQPGDVIDQRAFLEANADLNPLSLFLRKLAKWGDTLHLLASQPFEVARGRFYRAALEAASSEDAPPLVQFLANGMAALDKPEWEKALQATSGASLDLLELAGEVRGRDASFNLPLPARDAVVELVRRIGSGKPAPSDDIRGRLSKLIPLLPEAQRDSLARDVIDEMANQTDVSNLTRRIEAIGEHVNFSNDDDPDRIVRRILSPAVGAATERSAGWMAAIIGRQLDFFRSVRADPLNEFGLRLRAALNNRQQLTPAVVDSLTTIAGLLDIELTNAEEPPESPPSGLNGDDGSAKS